LGFRLDESARTGAAARGTVVEIGVGSGRNLSLYGTPVDRVFALDPSPELLAMAESQLAEARRPVTLLKASAEELPVLDHSVDTIVTTWTLCTIRDPIKALREMRRALLRIGWTLPDPREVGFAIGAQIGGSALSKAPCVPLHHHRDPPASSRAAPARRLGIAFDYFRTTRTYLEEHGKPVAFYSDKHGIFRVNSKVPSRGQVLEPVNRLAVALAVCVVHGGQHVGRPRRLELHDGQCEAGMTLDLFKSRTRYAFACDQPPRGRRAGQSEIRKSLINRTGRATRRPDCLRAIGQYLVVFR
jgi:SAM-dependent methyltransferase